MIDWCPDVWKLQSEEKWINDISFRLKNGVYTDKEIDITGSSLWNPNHPFCYIFAHSVVAKFSYFFFFFFGGGGGFRLLLSSVALSCFNQSLRGLVSIQHVLLSRFPWTRYQNQLKLPIPIEDQWIPPETSWIPLEETIEAHKQWVPLVSLVTGVDEPGTTW